MNIEGTEYEVECDYLITALGSKPDEYIQKLNLELNKWGNIKVNENYQTSDSKIFSGGDVAGMKGTVAWAAMSGREAAKKIKEKIS